jgi:hypothetical protein
MGIEVAFIAGAAEGHGEEVPDPIAVRAGWRLSFGTIVPGVLFLAPDILLWIM